MAKKKQNSCEARIWVGVLLVKCDMHLIRFSHSQAISHGLDSVKRILEIHTLLKKIEESLKICDLLP